MKNKIYLLLASYSLVALSGCAVVESAGIRQRATEKSEERKAVLKDELSKTYAGNQAESPLVVSKNEIFVSAKSSDARSDNTIPAAFSQIFLRFPGRYTLAALAERITKETRIPVSIDPDLADVRQSSGNPTNIAIPLSKNQLGSPKDPFAMGDSTDGKSAVEVYRNVPMNMYSEEFEIDFSGSLVDLLDMISAKGRMSWEYRKGVLYFSRTVTKTFFVNTLPGKTGTSRQMRTSVGSSGSGSAPAGSGTITSNIEFEPLENLAAAAETLKSTYGKIVINKSSGTITVTDLKENVNRIEKMINTEIQTLNRQVRLRVDLYSVRYSNTAQAGVDLNAAVTKVVNTNKMSDVTLTNGATLVGGDSGTAMIGISGTNGSASLVLKALNTIGKTTLLQRKAVTTLNRQSAPIVLSNQTTYLASTTPGQASVSGGGGVPGLTPGQVNTGMSLDVLPVINPDNTLLLQLGLDISELIRIGSISTGSGATLQQIQTPEVSAMSFLERVTLHNGETLVMVGYERDLTRGTGRDSLTGVSSDGDEEREAFLISVTAYLD